MTPTATPTSPPVPTPVPTIVADSMTAYLGHESNIQNGVINACEGDPADRFNYTWSSYGDSVVQYVYLSYATPITVRGVMIYWAYNNTKGSFMQAQRIDVKYLASDGVTWIFLGSMTWDGSGTASFLSTMVFSPITTTSFHFEMPWGFCTPASGVVTDGYNGCGFPNYSNYFWVTEISYISP